MIRSGQREETIRLIAEGRDITIRAARWKIILISGSACLWLSLMALMLWGKGTEALATLFALFPAAGWVLVVTECLSPTTLSFRQDFIETRMAFGRRRILRLAEVREFFVFQFARWVGSCAYHTFRPGGWLGMGVLPQMLTIAPSDLSAALNRRLAHYPTAERDAYFKARMRTWNLEAAVATRPNPGAEYLP